MKKIKGYARYMYDIKKCPVCGTKFEPGKPGYKLFVGGDGYSCVVCGETFASVSGREYLPVQYTQNMFDFIFGGRGTPYRDVGVKKYPAIWDVV